ncbi:hypothetical protein ACIGGF_13330 [Rhodococcus sp. NPDC078407]|uniref:hypothetical protein n=1 Tax=Rhodococcus sp. NPDC078407 TaxID=3364509 RepID=UPI0037C89C29
MRISLLRGVRQRRSRRRGYRGDFEPSENPWGAVTLPDGSHFRGDIPGASVMTLDGDPVEGVTLVKPSGTGVDVGIAASETAVDRPLLQATAVAVAGSVD